MTQIDALSGRELDTAVARALGYEVVQARPELWLYHGPDTLGWPQLEHYSTDIAAAWTLDGEGWAWRFEEWPTGKLIVDVITPEVSVTSYVELSEYATRAYAYATARCRAWLKARLAMPLH